jgi:tetratricopeptide (TPR) repeat protein
MLDKIVTLYRKAEMGAISGLSGAGVDVINETGFYDAGYMQSQISIIQKELKQVTSKIEASMSSDETDSIKKYRSELMRQREQLLFQMIFLASNSFNNLDDCAKMAEGHNIGFMQCVRGLQEYHIGNKDKAFNLLESYYREFGSVEEHFLINKVFGILLADRGQYKKAVSFLTYALQFVPDDIESLNVLQKCYQMENQSDRKAVVGEILAVLS